MTNLVSRDYTIKTRTSTAHRKQAFRDFFSSFRNYRRWEQLVKMLRTDGFQGVPVPRTILVIEAVSRMREAPHSSLA